MLANSYDYARCRQSRGRKLQRSQSSIERVLLSRHQLIFASSFMIHMLAMAFDLYIEMMAHAVIRRPLCNAGLCQETLGLPWDPLQAGSHRVGMARMLFVSCYSEPRFIPNPRRRRRTSIYGDWRDSRNLEFQDKKEAMCLCGQ